MPRRRPIARDLLVLTLLCAAAYAYGLTSHGITNVQEAFRAVAAHEMAERNDWLVPTINGKPYLNKPPMMYWWQLAIHAIRGGAIGDFELRLTVALAGWLGVIATYLATRMMLRAPPPDGFGDDGVAPPRDAWADDAAWWAGAMLATGLLYVRSSRIGELDILLAPFTVIGVAALWRAWMSHLTRRRADWGAIAVASVAAAGASLTKGPPGAITIVLAGYGGMMLEAAYGSARPTRAVRITSLLIGAVCAIAVIIFRAADVSTIVEGLGLAVLAGFAGLFGVTLARLASPAPFKRLLGAWSRTHPVIVIGIALGALWLWGRLVAARIGDAPVAHVAGQEAEDNLHFLVLGAPARFLEVLAYGAGLGSLCAIAGAAYFWRRRRSPAMWLMFAWIVLGGAAFAMVSRGSHRYFTPVLPGIAILGGAWLSVALANRAALSRAALAAVVLLALGEGAWYGAIRERYLSYRSPRALVVDLLRPEQGVDRNRLATLDFWTPAIDLYAGAPVLPVRFDASITDYMHEPVSLDDFAARIARGGQPWVLLARPGAAALDELRARGLTVEPVPLTARFAVDRRSTDVIAVRVSDIPDR